MTRTTNIKGMQAIIRSNVLKQLKRITETEKQNVTKFINSLSLEELKQKGLNASRARASRYSKSS